ncbi:MAG: AAA family ATPase [Acidobacteria bacterium]|nr:AAA family ATPase [Acidobacteriota bacterium]
MSNSEPPARNFTTERTLGAQRLAQYVQRNRCERYLRFALFPSEAKSLAARYRVPFDALSPLLSGAGQSYEREIVEQLSARERVRDLRNTSAAAFVAALREQTDGRTFYYQPRLEGRVGGWACEGYADLVRVERDGDTASLTVLDIKASRRETVGFRLQVAFYARLLLDAARQAGLDVASVEGAVLSRAHETKVGSDSGVAEIDPGESANFDLALYLDEIEQLVAGPDSDVSRAARASFETATFHLGAHCDGCPYNSVCFVHAAEREDLSLVPTLTSNEKTSLLAEGVARVSTLAGLMRYEEKSFACERGRGGDLRRIAARYPLNRRLPLLAQRARVALRRFDRSVEARRFLYGTGYGTLPDDALYPNLVKVFVDAQRDHLEDRLYMISALVCGANGTAEVIESTGAPPDTDAERALLVAWVTRLLPRIARAADTEDAPVHVYLFDRRSQRSLLDALARHFDALCAVPAFYDLLTSHPALTQSMISFLAEEVCERLNLSAICQNLYEVARELGFRWEGADGEIQKMFRARVFDNTRPFARDAETRQLTPAEAKERGAFTVESSARFGTEIPLEYAYSAWGLMPESPGMREEDRGFVRLFANVSMGDVRALASLRCKALRHIEESFRYKNRQVEKQPLRLARLDEVESDPASVPLSRALEDFLFLEHHARTQALMLHLALTPPERAQTGRTLLLRCESYAKDEGGERATFAVANALGDDDSVSVGESVDVGFAASPPVLKFREGDWIVVNPLADEDGRALPASKLVRGRLAVVEQFDGERAELRLLPMSFKNSAFRFPHRLFKPDAGALYTADEMADDLNSDKFLDACRHAATNSLYRWMCDAEGAKRPRPVRPRRLRDAEEIAALASRTQQPRGLTEAQRRVVGSLVADRVVVLQGPPGTGKSHTLGFAVLARALALSTPARPFRVAVCAKTHAATQIALGSIARRARELRDGAGSDARVAPLATLRIAKVSNDAGEDVPAGVERIYAGGDEDLSAAEQWEMLLGEPLLVVGGTPGGLYKLVKDGASRGRAVDWSEKYFDLVVVDEASQMGVAEALTAAAFLRDDGQFLAIGDHRQMPPILAHAWDAESRRDLKIAKPHLSIFEFLRALGFASAALDESFRIPAEIAEFLRRHVYAEDGVNFRSSNRGRLAAPDDLSGWLAAVFSPAHPLVVVEHDETGSQQSNEFEAALVAEIARVAFGKLQLDAERGVGVVVPHRAQKSLLQARVPQLRDSVDTVERFQGGERDLVVVSATVSDREFARAESDFLLEPRRLTVAVSRPRRKLVVVASRAVFDLIPSDLDEYERGALWKYLRHECAGTTLWEGEIGGHRVAVRALGGD